MIVTPRTLNIISDIYVTKNSFDHDIKRKSLSMWREQCFFLSQCIRDNLDKELITFDRDVCIVRDRSPVLDRDTGYDLSLINQNKSCHIKRKPLRLILHV